MTILTTKQNIPFLSKLTGIPEEGFKHSTKHTCTFQYPTAKFRTLYEEVKKRGNNPYAVMTW